MRITHVIDYFHTDVGYQEYYLAKYMAAAGHEVQVVSSGLRQSTVREVGPDEAAGLAALESAGVTVVRLRARQLGHDRAWLLGLERALSAFHPAAVHCHGGFGPTAIRVAMAKRRLGYTLLVDNHAHEQIAPAANSTTGRAGYAAYRKAAGPVLRRLVDHWVAIGPYERDFLQSRMGLKPDRVELIPLGFDPEVFDYDDGTRAQQRRERGWSEDLVVAVTGKIHARKRADLVARACAAAGRRLPIRLVIVGKTDPDARAAILQEAADLVREKRVEFLPMLGRRDLAQFYMAADVVVFARLPSISIFEAAGTGVRLLVGADAFSRWLQFQCATVEAVDPLGLAAHLKPARDRVHRAAIARAAFSWGTIAPRFTKLYASAGG